MVHAACLMLPNVPFYVTKPTLIRSLDCKTVGDLASIYLKQKRVDGSSAITLDIYFNFHTIMEAEETLAKFPDVTLNGTTFRLVWSDYPAVPFLVLGCFEDFPVTELLDLIKPHAVVKKLFKIKEQPSLVVLQTTTCAEAQTVQRNLHNSKFRNQPLFVGNEIPGFVNLRHKYYYSIHNYVPNVPEACYEAPSLVTQLQPRCTFGFDLNHAYKVLALIPQPSVRRALIDQLRLHGEKLVNQWNELVNRLDVE